MADAIIKSDELIQQDIFADAKKSGESLLPVLDNIIKSLQEIIKEQAKIASQKDTFSSFDNLKNAESAINKTKQAVDSLAKAQEARQKIIEKSIENQTEQIENLGKLTQELDKTKKELFDLNKEQKKSNKIDSESSKAKAELELKIKKLRSEISSTQKEILNSGKATDSLTDSEKENIKIKQRLERLKSEEAKTNALLNEQANRLARELRDEAKASLDSADAYKVLTKQTNEAQAEFKRLAAEFGVNSTQAKIALSEFEALEERLSDINKSAKDGRRNVGRYAESFNDISIAGTSVGSVIESVRAGFTLLATHPLIAVVIALSAALGVLFKAFQASEKGSKLLAQGAAIAEGVFASLVSIVDTLIGSIQNLSTEGISFEGIWNAILDNFYARLEALINVVYILGDAFDALISGDLSKIQDVAVDAFDNFVQLQTGIRDASSLLSDFGDEISKTTEKVFENANAFLKLEEAQRAVRIENRKLSIQLAELRGAQELLTAQADDDGVSLQRQRAFIQAAGDAREEESKKALRIAKNNLFLLNQEVSIRRKNGQEIQDLLDQRAQAEVDLIDAQNQAIISRFENGVRERQIILDIFDQELDDRIDFTDKLNTLDQERSRNEELSFENRRKALLRANTNQEKAFESQVQLFNDTVNALKESLGEEQDFSLPINDLLQIEDPVELNNAIASLDIVERQRIRLLELIKEQKTVTNNLATANRDLARSEMEIIEVQQEIIALEEAINKARESGADAEKIRSDLEEKRRKERLEAIEREIKVLEENSSERIELEREQAEILLNIELERLDKEKEAKDKAAKEDKEREEKRAEEQKNLQENTFEFLQNIIRRSNEARLNSLDNQLEESKNLVSELQQQAKEGNEFAAASLREERRNQAQLQREREREIRRQKRNELALAVINTYRQKVSDGSDNPLIETITETVGLQSFVDSLPEFFTGTEKVSKDLKESPYLKDKKRDKYHIRVDGGERILPTKLNNLIPSNVSNLELVRMAVDNMNGSDIVAENSDVSEIKSVFNEMKLELKSQKRMIGAEFDSFNKILKIFYSQNGNNSSDEINLRN